MSIFSTFLTVLFVLQTFSASAQLSYYLPEEQYNPEIPTPEDILGYQVGQWHVSHDQLLRYFQVLDEASERLSIYTYARSYENRPLIQVRFSTPERQPQMELLRDKRKTAILKGKAKEVDFSVAYIGYSIHGNEASGSNAAMLMAYYLAASNSERVQSWLEENIILLDPSFNPDGLQRFSTWVNMHRSQTMVTDPQTRQYDEVWPGGRTNHYWFDLNRDWLLVQHPESKGRITEFHRWLPNVLTDHHEMGTNSTFFFQPGIPSRNNPNTPKRNYELTGRMANYHAAALDSIGSLYYSKESYDDFYFGKGSTYPDINGAIGILFEQASSRGYAQESDFGVLKFPFTVRNQLVTSFSTMDALTALKDDFIDHQVTFYREAGEMAESAAKKAYIFQSPDIHLLAAFADHLQIHDIKVQKLAKDITLDQVRFNSDQSIIVPTDQHQYRLLETMMQKVTEFQDSLFYDVSAWTLPLAYDLTVGEYEGKNVDELLGEDEVMWEPVPLDDGIPYAYLIDWKDYYAAAALYELQQKGLTTMVANKDFKLNSGRMYQRGTIIIPTSNQSVDPEEVQQMIREIRSSHKVDVYAEKSGEAAFGAYLGSRSHDVLTRPSVAVLVGEGISSYDAGEVWHLLDRRVQAAVTLLDVKDFDRADLSRYNTLVMVDGNYRLDPNKLRNWISGGNLIIAYEDAVTWLAENGLVDVQFENEDKPNLRISEKNYETMSRFRGAQNIGGTIFQAQADLTHPLLYGYTDDEIPVFRTHSDMMKLSENPYANPLVYTDSPLLSGYISDENLQRLSGTASVDVSRTGNGRVISFMDNTNFRAYWYGTQRLFFNALFFGRTIDNQAAR